MNDRQRTDKSRRHPLARALLAASLTASLMASLTGCVEMVVGGAVVGTFAATDRRTLGAQTDDKTSAFKANARVDSLFGDSAHINCNSFNRRMLLTGEVRDQAAKDRVEREVAAIEGVQSVINELVIAPLTTYSARSNDALITGKVKAGLVDARDIAASSFKVVTERNVVYLMGRVTEHEAGQATEVARMVGGVERVVRVFDYITEEELRQLNTPSTGAASAKPATKH